MNGDNRNVFSITYDTPLEFLVDFASRLSAGFFEANMAEPFFPGEPWLVHIRVALAEGARECDVEAVAAEGTGGKQFLRFTSTAALRALAQTFCDRTQIVPTVRVLRRKSARVHAILFVTYFSSRQLLNDVSSNVSREGMFIVSEHPLQVGDGLSISLTLPDGAVLDLEAEVVHSVRTGPERGMGVRFTRFFGDSRTHLALFIEQALAEQAALVSEGHPVTN